MDMEEDRPFDPSGCELRCGQLASQVTQLHECVRAARLHIQRLERRVESLEMERDVFKDTLLRLLSGKLSRQQPARPVLTGKPQLPPPLDTEQAHRLWRKLQAAGLVDDNYQPLVSNAQAALIADEMAVRLNITKKWKYFGDFWNLKYMKSDLFRIKSQRQMIDFLNHLKATLDD
jgi:hypothetical protein